MKPIRLSAHATGYITKRGFTVAEVESAILYAVINSAFVGAKQQKTSSLYLSLSLSLSLFATISPTQPKSPNPFASPSSSVCGCATYIRSSSWEPAELERWQCRQDFPFNQVWNGKVYGSKQVRPVFVEKST